MISEDLLNKNEKQSLQTTRTSHFPLIPSKETTQDGTATTSPFNIDAEQQYDMGSFANSMAKYAGMFSNGAFSNSFSMGTDTSCKPTPANTENVDLSTKTDKDNMLLGLFKIFIAVLKIPTKFDLIFNGIKSAGNSLALGLEGAVKSSFLGIEDLVLLFIFLYTFISKYITCIFGFFMTLPYCFMSHIITCISSILYLIFPLTSYIFWSGTGVELMPYYETMFLHIDAFDDNLAEMIGFHFTKFPNSIIKKCYTCNNKVLRLKDILKDAMKVTKISDKIRKDAGKTIPRFMKPAMPHIYKTAYYVNKIFA